MLLSTLLTAQKTVHKVVEDTTITSITIDASHAYELVVKTSASSKIDIKAIMEGEYKDDLLINTKKESGRFVVSTAFRPLYKNPNDKLSAHKVISILMIVELPENMELMILGSGVNIDLSGTYKTLNANITQGNFTITDFEGNGEIQTFEGAISVSNYEGSITAYSKYGKIHGRNTAKGKGVLTLKTVNGSIYINKPK